MITFNAFVVAIQVSAGELLPVRLEVEGQIEFSPSDLEYITSQVLTTYPIISSSPGVKYAAVRAARSKAFADLIYYPHTETAGLKQALQVRCHRPIDTGLWTCCKAGIRSYLQIMGQDFEVRVLGGIEARQALALIEATRFVALTNPSDDPEIPETAIMIMPENDVITVTWGSPEGHQKLTVGARLVEGGNPNDKGDWQAYVHEYPK